MNRMISADMPKAPAALLLVLAMCFTGTNVPLGKSIVADLPVYAFVLLRFLIATAVLALIARSEPGPRLREITGRQLLDVLALAALGSLGYMTLSLEGVKRTSSIDAGIILATLPAITALFGFMLRGERPGTAQAAAILLAVAGLGLVNTAAASSPQDGSTLGNLLVGAAVLCEASFVLISGRIGKVYRPIRLSLAVSAAGLVMAVPLGTQQLLTIPLAGITPATWLGVVWYALSASVFCTILWYWGAPHIETWRAGLTTAALPVSAMAVAVLLLGEDVGWPRLAGAALVIAGIVIGALAPARTPG